MSSGVGADDGDGDDPATTARFARYRTTGDRALRNELLVEHRGIAEAIARRFANRGEPLEDLEQVAMLGLVKAIERFDPQRGIPFAGFAVPTITGELRRHFRDATWAVKVSRRAKDLHVRLHRLVGELTSAHGRPPTPAELAEALEVSLDDVLDTLDAGAAYRTTSTDTADGLSAAGRSLQRSTDPGLSVEDRVLLQEMLAELPEREQTIVGLRFFEDLSQSEIAERVGTSQVHVSRLLRRTLRTLQERHDDTA